MIDVGIGNEGGSRIVHAKIASWRGFAIIFDNAVVEALLQFSLTNHLPRAHFLNFTKITQKRLVCM